MFGAPLTEMARAHKVIALHARGHGLSTDGSGPWSYWSASVADIEAPTLLIFADADMMRPEHVVEFYKLLGGGQRDAGLDGSLRKPFRAAPP
ncbi:MAG TPA: hypothetical protein VFT04_06085 [Gemmatimonadales bacterium]|nr:hypothetical protein [Gemmatimonadales bacterium]